MRTAAAMCTVAFGLLLIFSSTASAATGVISGAVVDGGSNDPIEHIEVCAYSAKSWDLGGCALTDANGEYTLGDIPEGIYVVEFWAIPSLNYLTQFYNGKTDFEEADFVFVTSGANASGIDAELQSGGSISGQVADAGSHQAVSGVEVCAGTVDESTYRCATSGAGGVYTVGKLPTGSYKVVFRDDEGSPGHLIQYYDRKSRWEEATPVSVTVGQPVVGIDAMLQQGAWVTGTITEASGNPVRWTSACALTLFETYADCTWSDSTGAYELGWLAPGAYKVVFSQDVEEESEDGYATRYYDEKSSFGLADQLILGEGSVIANVNARLERNGKITEVSVPSTSSRQARAKGKKRKCKKGYRRKLVRGKRRCTRIVVHRHHKPSRS